MKRTYLIDPVKCGIAGVFSVFLLILLPEFIRQQNLLGAILFGGVGLVFLGIALYSGRLLTISPEGIAVSFLGLGKKEYSWQELREVGVIGLKVFKKEKSKATGLLYIYFSTTHMEDQERFDLALRWPRNHVPYMLYSKKRLDAVQELWDRPLTFYNSDKVKFDFR